MSIYTTIVSTEQAAYMATTVAHVETIEIWPAGTVDTATIALPEDCVRYLQGLPKDCDGHIDASGSLWIGGTDYPLEVIR